ncbi:MAG TPA: glycosyltransferase [Polyangiaceae bacterium]|jgi:glycosyltransferase involved in cell wall biosynthesis|nr:glycosyltransferase [Polyangiaceae bacterium]
MRIGFVSSYRPQRCGVAAYTAALAGGMRASGGGHELFAFSEMGSLTGSDGTLCSVPTFRRADDYVLAVAARAATFGIDVLHVQHSSDILGVDERLPRLLTLLRARGVRTVVTLHSVHSPRTAAFERLFGVSQFHRNLGALADAVVVHGARGMRDELVRQGLSRSKVHVIGHGTELVGAPSREEARAQLGLPAGVPLLLCFGFLHPQKSLHTVLLAMRRLARRVPEARLCLAGHVQNPNAVNRAYLACLHWLAERGELADRIILRRGYATDADARAFYRAADIVLLPYRQSYGSASGVAHQAAGAGRLMLCSASPKFAEVGESIDPSLVVPTQSAEAWAGAIAGLLCDSKHRDELTERVARFAKATSWPSVGERHLALYRRVMGRA